MKQFMRCVGDIATQCSGKRGKREDIQTFKCQCCQTNFSSRRNTPLYRLKTHPDQVEMCLWLLAEGMDISVLVWFTGHVDAPLLAG